MCEQCFIDLIEQNEGRWLHETEARAASKSDAEDFVHDAIAEAWEDYLEGRFDPCRPDASGWIDNKLRWRLSRENQKPQRSEGDDFVSTIPDVRFPPPPERAMSEEACQAFWDAVAQLDPDDQMIVVLHLGPWPRGYEGGRAQWIADLLGVRRSRVSQRYHKAKRSLEKRLGPTDWLPE